MSGPPRCLKRKSCKSARQRAVLCVPSTTQLPRMDQLANDYDSSGDERPSPEAKRRRVGDAEDGLQEGVKVRVQGLVSEAGRPFNGKTATVVYWNPTAGRYHVRLDTGGTINCKPENVTKTFNWATDGPPNDSESESDDLNEDLEDDEIPADDGGKS